MSAQIPYGAISGFVLAVDMREIAAHYGVRWRLLRGSGDKGEQLAHARDALAWKLIQQRKLTPQRAGDLIGMSAKTAREAAARHAHRVAQFRSTYRMAKGAADAA